jgi:hypothetical protein
VRSHALIPALLHLNNTPITSFQVPLHVVRQNRALVARFLIYGIKPTPLEHRSIPQSQALNPGLIHLNNTPPTRSQVPPHVVRQNRALEARFSIYSLKFTPLASHLIVWSQALSPTLLHLNNTPLTRLQVAPHVVRQNRALAARFLIYSLKLTPLASHLIVRPQALRPTLLHLNNTQLTCLGVFSHVCSQNRALAARFLIYSLKFTPLASHLIVPSQALIPTLLHLNNTPLTRFRVPPHVFHQNRALAARFLIFYNISIIYMYINLVFNMT